tara:strand:- start:256 stop:444 length:189 start_codon:yes stop_codon:yes gene_type:complete
MENALEKKRGTYLGFFKEGIVDAFLNKSLYEEKKSSYYYKMGYQFGLYLENLIKEKEAENEK